MFSTFLRRFKQLPKLLFSVLLALICCRRRRKCKNCNIIKEVGSMINQQKHLNDAACESHMENNDESTTQTENDRKEANV